MGLLALDKPSGPLPTPPHMPLACRCDSGTCCPAVTNDHWDLGSEWILLEMMPTGASFALIIPRACLRPSPVTGGGAVVQLLS